MSTLGLSEGARNDPDDHYSSIFQSKTIEVVLTRTNHKSQVPTIYHLHIDRLTEASKYFSCLFQFAGKEVTENKVTLSETADDPQAFKYFVEYIYRRTYTIPASYEAYTCLLHVMVYVLADRLMAPQLKTLAMKNLVEYLSNGRIEPADRITIKMIAAVYNGTCVEMPKTDADEERKQHSRAGHDSLHEYFTSARRDRTPDIPSATEALEKLDFDSDYEDPDTDTIQPINPLRKLVSSYAASRLDRLKKQSRFRNLMKEFPDFAEDMMLEAQNGRFVPPQV